MRIRRSAFTLAEVLITLTIIGVVASTLIPALVNNTYKRELLAQVTKQYSALQNMARMYRAQNGGAGMDSLFETNASSTRSYDALKEMSKYIRMQKMCNNSACWTQTTKYATPRNNGYGSYNTSFKGLTATAILADGATLAVSVFGGEPNSNCSHDLSGYKTDADGNYILDGDGKPVVQTYTHTNCADLAFDANGPKPPNQFGADTFFLVSKADQILPYTTAYYGDLKKMLTDGTFTNTNFDPATYTK